MRGGSLWRLTRTSRRDYSLHKAHGFRNTCIIHLVNYSKLQYLCSICTGTCDCGGVVSESAESDLEEVVHTDSLTSRAK